ncbi:STE3-domain-containing protein [Peniophora sp. CONT]|nr:STE3-domain-containing protein [Peniophora sp. CONT]
MAAADPTYPLYPIALVLSSAMLLLVLTTNFVRQSWNFGVASLCFWLFFENITSAVNAIIWSDNADLKLYVYCDIVTHLQEITYVVKPMATLIITRRLYLIASHQSVKLPSKAARCWDVALEWTLGLIIPILVAGPIYYVNQGARFQVDEGFGCANAAISSILEIIIGQSWAVVPPLISIIFYYPRVAWTYYRQRRDTSGFLGSDSSVSRTNYFRILVLASIDILLTLPIGIVGITLNIVSALSPPKDLPFYPGWTSLHTDWEPVGVPYANLQAGGPAILAQNYFSAWTSPVLAFAIFGLFGVTSEACASYWRIICIVGGWVGWKPSTRRGRIGRASVGEIEFGARPQDASGFDLEMGSHTQSFAHADVPATHPDCKNALGVHAEKDPLYLKSGEGAHRNSEEGTGDAHFQNYIKYHELVVERTSSDVLETFSNKCADSFEIATQGSDAKGA